MGTLVLQGNGTLPQAGRDLSPLTVSVQNLDRSILRVKIGAPGRWEVPAAQLFTSTAQGELLQAERGYSWGTVMLPEGLQLGLKGPLDNWLCTGHMDMCAGQQQGRPSYSLQYSSSPFGFDVSRAGGGAAPLFNTAGNRIIFKVTPQAGVLQPGCAAVLQCMFSGPHLLHVCPGPVLGDQHSHPQ